MTRWPALRAAGVLRALVELAGLVRRWRWRCPAGGHFRKRITAYDSGRNGLNLPALSLAEMERELTAERTRAALVGYAWRKVRKGMGQARRFEKQVFCNALTYVAKTGYIQIFTKKLVSRIGKNKFRVILFIIGMTRYGFLLLYFYE
jgi:hypothetical protein